MNLFSFFGWGKFKNAMRNGAVIIDIRTPHEFDRGRVPDSINIPLDRISINTERLKTIKRPIIICSNSFYESSIVVKKLKKAGIRKVLNGGTWNSLGKIQQKR